MIANPFASADKIQVGNDAGWLLAFHRLDGSKVAKKPVCEFGRDDYYADIQASLPAGLEGGAYSFTVAGLTDKDYAKISIHKDDNPLIVRLYLFWRDAIPGLLNGIGAFVKPVAALADVLGPTKAEQLGDKFLVAELEVVNVTRKAGARLYETTITAVERIHAALSRAGCSPSKEQGAIDASDVHKAVTNLLQRTTKFTENSEFRFYGKESTSSASEQQDNKRNLPAGRRTLELLKELASRMERESKSFGRGMLLIRNGVLHIGKRPIPLDAKDPNNPDPKKLTPRNGLIEVETLQKLLTDPFGDTCSNKPPASRAQFKLTLKGRPDLKPGDMVLFEIPNEDDSSTRSIPGKLLGALADSVSGPLLPTLSDDVNSPAVKMYVTSVEHKLGRNSGFITTVTGVKVGDKDTEVKQDDMWDQRTRSASARRSNLNGKTAHAGIEAQLGQAVGDAVQKELGPIQLLDIGEVREASADQQLVRIWEGLTGEARAHEARTLEVARPTENDLPDAPYLTPFAWSKCGLVLPRYPGTRVMVAHRLGQTDDVIDAGALWKTSDVPGSKAGDWWLILPANVPQSDRDKFKDDDATPVNYTDVATHDLIDADGNRVIEVGALSVRVGKSNLTKAGSRPQAPGEDSITIEHRGRKVLTVDKNGNITLDAGSNNITLKAANVDIEVTGAVNVK